MNSENAPIPREMTDEEALAHAEKEAKKLEKFKVLRELLRDSSPEIKESFEPLIRHTHPISGKPITSSDIINRLNKWPYYTLSCGKEMKLLLETIKASGKSRFIPYSAFPQFKRTTILARIRQGMHYAVDMLDETGELKAFYESLVIADETKAVAFRVEAISLLTAAVEDDPSLSNEPSKDETIYNEVRLAVTRLIEEGSINEVYSRDKLNLTAGQINSLTLLLVAVEDEVVFKITETSIKVLKTGKDSK